MMMKNCADCNCTFEAERNEKYCPVGCRQKRQRSHYRNNCDPKKRRERKRRWRAKHPELHREHNRRWREKSREWCRAYGRVRHVKLQAALTVYRKLNGHKTGDWKEATAITRAFKMLFEQEMTQ